ncbi:MAG: acyltransferase family protein [Desulfobulbus sp.]|jgi:peptidoglycan/LPS O-acetylase OafA/YrhL
MRSYLRSIEYYRAVAITLIVAGHCYHLCGWRFTTLPEHALANIISGCTTLFVFISGFLFHWVFYPRFQYGPFLLKKLRNVGLPYLLFSIPAITLALLRDVPQPEFFFGAGTSLYDRILRPAGLYLLTGASLLPYWYIPFILVLFALSPLFLRFIEARPRIQTGLLIVLFVVAGLVGRPLDNLCVGQSVLCFLPFYLLGMVCSLQQQRLYAWFSGGRDWALLFGVVVLACAQTLVYPGAGMAHKPAFQFQGLDLNLVQKVLFCLWLLVFLHRFEDCRSRVLTALASSSFSLYFIHWWLIVYVLPPLFTRIPKQWQGLALLPLAVVLALAGSYGVAWVVRRLFPRYSRMLIGW